MGPVLAAGSGETGLGVSAGSGDDAPLQPNPSQEAATAAGTPLLPRS